MIGGLVALDYQIRRGRQAYPNSLLLDAGDICTGTPISKIEYKGAKNGAFVEMMNRMGYDAFTIGNHEFDEGQENLHKLIEIAEFKVLSCNLYLKQNLFAPQPFSVFLRNGVRIGVIGVLMQNLADVVSVTQVENVRLKSPAQTVQAIINDIDAKTDVIVVLTHQGIEPDLSLADSLVNADIIIGGHSHTRLTRPVVRNKILVVQAGSKTRYLGRLTVDVLNDEIAEYEYNLIPTWVDSVKNPDSELKNMVDKFKQEIDETYNKRIGTLHTDWVRKTRKESNIGNYLCDVIRVHTRTDVALLNSGGIRKNLSAGPITKLDIYEILPFTNYVVKFNCSGKQVLDLIHDNIQAAVSGEYGINQISGLTYSYRINNGNGTLIKATINGEPVDPEKHYSCATVDYLYGQLTERGGYSFHSMEQTPYLISEMVIEHILEHPNVKSNVKGRIQRKK